MTSNSEISWSQGQNGQYRNLYPHSDYDPTAYERPCHTVDIAICRIRDNQLQVLLIKRKYPPFADCWAIPGGFVDIIRSEKLIDAAYRELAEETGVTGIPIRELGTFGDPDRDPRWRIISTVYYALVAETVIDKTTVIADSDAKEYGWFDLRDLPELAFDHDKILWELTQRIREQALYHPLAIELLPKLFTWADLQNAFEILIDKKLVASNFRRDISHDYIIEETKQKENPKPGRKGRLGVLCQFVGRRERFGRSS